MCGIGLTTEQVQREVTAFRLCNPHDVLQNPEGGPGYPGGLVKPFSSTRTTLYQFVRRWSVWSGCGVGGSSTGGRLEGGMEDAPTGIRAFVLRIWLVFQSLLGETLAPCGGETGRGLLWPDCTERPNTRMVRDRISELVVHFLNGTMGVPG